MNRNKLAVLISLALIAAGSAAAETIMFTNQAPSNGEFTTDTEGNFTVNNTAGQYLVGHLFGAPAPDLFIYQGDATITVTRNDGGNFTFSSVDLAATYATNTYVITGLLDGSSVFSFTGAVSGNTTFGTYGTGDSADVVDALTIRLNNADAESDLDNIVVNATATSVTPEPSSFVLLGTGVVGMAGAMRRRLWA